MTDHRQVMQQALDKLTEYMHPSDAMLMRCHPKLIAASQTLLAALNVPEANCGNIAAPQAEPLFLLHTGQIDSGGEQDEWETEADSQVRVDAFCRQHPGQTIGLYPAPAADVVRDAERYRWLRHGDNDELVLMDFPDGTHIEGPAMYLPRMERLDAAIDAAMKGADHA